jgi:hypothetical protein
MADFDDDDDDDDVFRPNSTRLRSALTRKKLLQGVLQK